MSLFDTAAKVAFNTTLTLMGDSAEWHKKDDTVVSAKVHFKDPSSIVKIGDKEYDPRDGIIEYKRGDFPGLKELVDMQEQEHIKVMLWGTVYEFLTVKDKKLYDGQTIQVKLQRKTTP